MLQDQQKDYRCVVSQLNESEVRFLKLDKENAALRDRKDMLLEEKDMILEEKELLLMDL